MKLDELNKKREQYQTEGNILKEIEILREILIETEKLYGLFDIFTLFIAGDLIVEIIHNTVIKQIFN